MTRRFHTGRLLAVAILAAAAASTSADAQFVGGRRDFIVATATPTGNYFAVGNALCRLLQRQGLYLESGDVTLIGCGATATLGSLQNVELLRTRAVEFALVQSDWQHHAYQGTSRFEGRRMDQLRSLLSLNLEPFQLLAARGTNIDTWGDLKGKKVNLGPPGTTSFSMFEELFALHRTDDKWLAQGMNLPVTSHVQELCEGNVEALGQTTGAPNSGLAVAIRRCGATIISLDTQEIRRHVAERAYYAPVLIPKDTYAGQPYDVRTFGVLATLMATSDVPEIAAYSMVRAVFEGLDELKAMLPVLHDLKPERMIKDGLSTPLHPGALRYYQERGWMKEEKPTLPPSVSAAVDALASAATTPQQQATAPPAAEARAPTAAPVKVKGQVLKSKRLQ